MFSKIFHKDGRTEETFLARNIQEIINHCVKKGMFDGSDAPSPTVALCTLPIWGRATWISGEKQYQLLILGDNNGR